MARKRYTDVDVLNLLRQIELSLASGSSIEMACRSAGISDATYYNWRKRYGGMGFEDKFFVRKIMDSKLGIWRRRGPGYLDFSSFLSEPFITFTLRLSLTLRQSRGILVV